MPGRGAWTSTARSQTRGCWCADTSSRTTAGGVTSQRRALTGAKARTAEDAGAEGVVEGRAGKALTHARIQAVAWRWRKQRASSRRLVTGTCESRSPEQNHAPADLRCSTRDCCRRTQAHASHRPAQREGLSNSCFFRASRAPREDNAAARCCGERALRLTCSPPAACLQMARGSVTVPRCDAALGKSAQQRNKQGLLCQQALLCLLQHAGGPEIRTGTLPFLSLHSVPQLRAA